LHSLKLLEGGVIVSQAMPPFLFPLQRYKDFQ
jgi:hypothetical protein